MALRTVGVRLVAEVSDYQRKMRQAGKDTKDFAGELATASKAGNLDAVADQAAGAGLALAGVAGAAVKLSMDFEKAMSGVSAATHASAGDMEQLRQAALEAGKDTQYSATEAAKGITELSKAGVATADILGGGLDGALDLAAAGQMEVADAAEVAASAMVQFKLKGQDLPHVADLLAAAAGKAQGTVADMGQALNQAGLVAAQTGLTIEETTGGLAAFASAGLTGSDAGTSFKQMLLMLQAPSDKTRDLMTDLGISAYDAQGQFIGLTNLAQQLRDKMAHLTPELRANAMAQIFGADAVRASSILYEQGGAGIQSWIDKVNDAGYASETAAKLTDNLAGDLERLKGSLETLAIESGSGANSGLRVIAQSVEALVDEFGELPSAVSGTAVVLAALGGAALLGVAGWVKMRRATADAAEELRASGPAGERAAKGLENTTKWAGRAAGAFVAMEVAAVVFDKLGNGAVNVDRLTGSLTNYANTGKLTEGVTDAFGKNLEDFSLIANSAHQATHGFWGGLNDLTSAIPGVGSAIDSLNERIYGTSFNDATEKMEALDQSFAAFIGTQKDAAKAGELWNRLINESGLETDQLAALLPNAWKGLQELQAKAHGVGVGTKEAAGGIKDVGAASEKAAKQAEELNKQFEKLFDAQMSADRAAIKLKESTVDLTKELTEGKRTLSLYSEEGRKNRTAVLDQLEAIEDLREARIKEGMALDVANGKYAKDVQALRKSMEQAGFTKKEIDRLIGSYEKLPQRKPTDITTPGLPAAREGIKGYDKQLDQLARNVRTQVSVEGKAKAQKELEDLLIMQQAAKKGISVSAARSAFNKNAYAGGGWTGPGDTYDEAGVVHADEFVIRKSSRRKIEAAAPGLLDYMNQQGRVPEHVADTTPGYAGGGLVMPFPVNARDTMIPEWSAPVGPGGATGAWMKQMLEARFGVKMISGPRPGARTLSGSASYHGAVPYRAVDFPPVKAMAEFMYNNYKASLKEAITPYQQYNVHHGRDRHWTGAVWNQHNFAGGNAHNHFAMADGGVIREPVFGVGASGATYSFGENYQPERVVPMAGGGGGGGPAITYQINVSVPPNANQAEVGRVVVGAIQAYERGSGKAWRS